MWKRNEELDYELLHFDKTIPQAEWRYDSASHSYKLDCFEDVVGRHPFIFKRTKNNKTYFRVENIAEEFEADNFVTPGDSGGWKIKNIVPVFKKDPDIARHCGHRCTNKR